jgi:hypothetical protein
MTNILVILAIAAAAIGATQMFSNSTSSQIKTPVQAPAPGSNGGGKRKTKKNRKSKKNRK